MKIRSALALLLVCGMLAPTLLCSCKKGGSTDPGPTETEDDRIDLGSISSENTSSTDQDSTSKKVESLSAFEGPSLDLLKDVPFYKQIELNMLAVDPTFHSTIPEATCCLDDGVWMCIHSGKLIQFDYEGNHLQTIELDESNPDLFDELQSILGMYYKDGALHLMTFGYEDRLVHVYAVDQTTKKMNLVIKFPSPIGYRDLGNIHLIDATEEGLHMDFWPVSLSGVVGTPTICTISYDGKLLNAVTPDSELLGGWYIDDQFHVMTLYDGTLNSIVLSRIEDKGGLYLTHYLDAPSTVWQSIVTETAQYLVDYIGIWKMDRKTNEWSCLLLWQDTDIDWSGFNNTQQVAISPDGQKIIVFNTGWDGYTTLLVPSEDPREGRTVISLSGVDRFSDHEFMGLVYEFNHTNEDYYIEIDDDSLRVDARPYRTDGIFDQITYCNALVDDLNKKLKSGQGPVLLLDDGQENNRITQTSSGPKVYKSYDEVFAHKEYFRDLLPYWQKEDPAWQALYLESVSRSIGKNDHLYAVPLETSELEFSENYTALGSGKMAEALAKENSYTNLLAFLKNNEVDLLTSNMTSETFLYYALSRDLSSFRKNDGTVDLNDPQFRALLEIAGTYLISENNPKDFSQNGNYLPKVAASLIHSDLVNMSVEFRDPYGGPSFYYPDTTGRQIAFPSASGGNTGLVHASRQFRISSSATREQADGAWAFIRFSLEKNSNFKLSIIQETLDAFEHPTNHRDYWYAIFQEDLIYDPANIVPLPHEKVAECEQKIRNHEEIVMPDAELYTIVLEETSGYMKGTESADETIARLQKRINQSLAGN